MTDSKMLPESNDDPKEKCPRCGKHIKYKNSKYCTNCGQKLKSDHSKSGLIKPAS